MSKGAMSELLRADIVKFVIMLKSVPKSEYSSIISAFKNRAAILEGC